MTLVAKEVAAWDLWIRGQLGANRMRKKATMRGMSCGRETLMRVFDLPLEVYWRGRFGGVWWCLMVSDGVSAWAW